MKQTSSPKSRRSGFTLIELMIVVSIIGILAIIAIPKFADMVRKAREASTKGKLGALRSALSIYYSDMEGYFPAYCATAACDFTAPFGLGVGEPTGLEMLTVNGKYLSALPTPDTPYYHVVDPNNGPPFASGIEVDIIDFSNTPGPNTFETNSAVAGRWIYFGNPLTGIWGQVFVDCTHTDSRGTLWTNY